MTIKKIAISLIATSVLFTACGGGGGDSTTVASPAQDKDYGDLKTKTKTSFNVLANQATYVSVLTGNKFINTDTSDSYYKYIVKNKGTAKTAKFVSDYGVLRYENSGASDTVIVAIKDTRDSKESAPITLTFNVMDEGSIQEATVLKTGQLNDDYGVDRKFKRDAETRFNVQDEVSGLVWNDLASNVSPSVNVTFSEAANECKGQGKRLPTVEELYSTILYKSDNFKKGMLDPIFTTKLIYSWASDGTKMMNNTFGYVAGSGKAEFRCVEGSNPVVEHTIMTDLVSEDSYDLSTKLQWSKASSTRMGFAEAKTYCEEKKNDWGHDNWKLPTINQLRSIIDDGIVAASVIHASPNLLSSTQVADDTGTFYLGVSLTEERTDYVIGPFNETQAAAITCVRSYSPSELGQIKQ